MAKSSKLPLVDREVRAWTLACYGLAAVYAALLIAVVVRDIFPCNTKLTEILETPAGWQDWPQVDSFEKFRLMGGAENCTGADENEHCVRSVQLTAPGVCPKNTVSLNSWFFSHVRDEPREGEIDPKKVGLTLRASAQAAETFIVTGREFKGATTELPIAAFRREASSPPPLRETLRFSAIIDALLFGVLGLILATKVIRISVPRMSKKDRAKNAAIAATIELRLKLAFMGAAIYGGIVFVWVMLSLSST